MEAQDNPFTSILMVGAADPEALAGDADPGAGSYRLVMGTDDKLYILDETGNAVEVGAAAGAVATDAIWDAAGDLAVGSGANTAAKLTKGSDGTVLTMTAGAVGWAAPSGGSTPVVSSAIVNTSESTASGSYTDLTTSGPSVTVTVPASGVVKVTITCQMSTAGAANNGRASVDLSGANTVASSDTGATLVLPALSGTFTRASRTRVFTGLTPGSTTFKMQYGNVTATTRFYSDREIIVETVP